jgi:hypothetical protein
MEHLPPLTPDPDEPTAYTARHRANPEDTTTPDEATGEREDYLLRYHHYVETYQGAFRAFLTLPDIPAGSMEVFEAFDRAIVGSFPLDREVVLAQTTEYGDVKQRITEIAAVAGYADFVSIDVDGLWARVQDLLYDIVEHEGEYHVFLK